MPTCTDPLDVLHVDRKSIEIEIKVGNFHLYFVLYEYLHTYCR